MYDVWDKCMISSKILNASILDSFDLIHISIKLLQLDRKFQLLS